MCDYKEFRTTSDVTASPWFLPDTVDCELKANWLNFVFDHTHSPTADPSPPSISEALTNPPAPPAIKPFHDNRQQQSAPPPDEEASLFARRSQSRSSSNSRLQQVWSLTQYFHCRVLYFGQTKEYVSVKIRVFDPTPSPFTILYRFD